LSNAEFVSEEIKRLLAKGIVQEVQDMPYVVNPLTVAFGKSGKARLVLDCRHLNPHLHLFKVKFEDIKVAEALFHPGSFLFTYDLKAAYHHIDIFAQHMTYLGFSWVYEGRKRYFVYCSLPFGICTAGHIFTKMLRVVVAHLRSQGHKIIMFLDDGIGGGRSYSEALLSSQVTQSSLLEFGFLLAHDKCFWEPQRNVVWLGYALDFLVNKIFIKEERICRLEQTFDDLLDILAKDGYPLVSSRFLASVIGQIISMQFVLGGKVRMLTRHMYNCVLSRASWNAPILVTEEARKEICFWRQNARMLNEKGRDLSVASGCDFSVFCDASAKGYGGFLLTDESSLSEGGLIHADAVEAPDKAGEYQDRQVGRELLPEVSTGRNGSYEHAESSARVENSVWLPEASIGCPEREAIRDDCSKSKDLRGANGKYFTLGSGVKLPEESAKSGTVGKGRSNVLNGSEVVGSWSDSERLKSSTWRETEAIRRVIHSNVEKVRGKQIQVYSDNKNTTSIILNGSRCADIHAVASDIADVCEVNNISMLSQWIPRT